MPIGFRVVIPTSAGRDFVGEYFREMRLAIMDCQQYVIDQAVQNIGAHTRTGTGRRSITAEALEISGNRLVAPIGAGGAGAPYLQGLEEGTGLWGPRHARYPIRPVNKKALAWPSPAMGAPGGQYRRLSGSLRTNVLRKLQSGKMAYSEAYIVRKSVMHPGHPPMPFLEPALIQSIPKIEARIQTVIDKVFRST